MTDSAIDSIAAALETGDSAAAERLCREGLLQKPEDADLSVMLAVSLWQQDRQTEATEIYAALTRRYPNNSMHWRNYAAVLRKLSDLEGSERAYEAAARLAPDDAEVLELYGLVQQDLGKHVDARNTLLRAFGKQPDSVAIRIHAAHACSICHDSRAESLLQSWREWLPLDDHLQSELIEVMIRQGEAGTALKLLEDYARRHPGERSVYLRLAALYERVNRIDEAETILDALDADGRKPIGGLGAQDTRAVSKQRAQLAMRRGEHAAARKMLENLGPDNDSDTQYWFALARACDRTGDTSAAMRAWGFGHTCQIEELKHVVPHFFEPGTEILARAGDRVSADDFRVWPRLEAPDASQSPVFVVGFPRSGTTLLEQMLDAHPRLQSMDERPFFNMLASQLENSTGVQIPRDLGRLDQRDCDELRKGYLVHACGKVPRRWDTRLVDKNPLNMLWLPMICRMFPRAKLIIAIRHPCDVILSCYMQNFQAPVLAVAGRSLDSLARAYVAAMENWLHHVQVFKPDLFVSRYEDLVANTTGQTHQIADFLGLNDADTMLNFAERARAKGNIKTPSYTQVIEPINSKGIDRWQRYREYFEPALQIIKPMLEHWGYAAGQLDNDGIAK